MLYASIQNRFDYAVRTLCKKDKNKPLSLLLLQSGVKYDLCNTASWADKWFHLKLYSTRYTRLGTETAHRFISLYTGYVIFI